MLGMCSGRLAASHVTSWLGMNHKTRIKWDPKQGKHAIPSYGPQLQQKILQLDPKLTHDKPGIDFQG